MFYTWVLKHLIPRKLKESVCLYTGIISFFNHLLWSLVKNSFKIYFVLILSIQCQTNVLKTPHKLCSVLRVDTLTEVAYLILKLEILIIIFYLCSNTCMGKCTVCVND